MKPLMTGKRCRRWAVGLVLCGGTLFAGPCGITTLQFKDFVFSALIRATVNTGAQIVQATVIPGTNGQDN
ncbi:MAG: hypothetical protein HY763_11955 [Planctomycetes bacterium]|nr:hypothetical protein [Planctomycetota bacterium]